MKFESKIAALLGIHLLFARDAGTKQLIGCKWVMEKWIKDSHKVL